MANSGERITVEVLNLLMPLVGNEIGDKCLKGINWALVKDTDKVVQDEYTAVRRKLTSMGFSPAEAMRLFRAPNGFIFDLDAIVLKRMVAYLVAGTEQEQNCKRIISDAYEKRKTSEMFRLADLVEDSMKRQRQNSFLVALFNTTNNLDTRFTGNDEQGQPHTYKLPAFALRHCDLQECNLDYIMPRGYRIKKMDIIEIIPSCKGVSYRLYCEPYR